MIEWLPEFALRDSERAGIGTHNMVAKLAAAAHTVYTSEKYQKRGEPGELLLHIALRQVFGTIPAVAKFFFKDAANDTVKGFDAVHVVAGPAGLELWLGEAKFYKDPQAAIRAAVKDLQRHLETDYLRLEFAAITNKIDPGWPHADQLRKLLHPNTSLDEVFASAAIPVLLAYDSSCVSGHKAVTAEFIKTFETEVRSLHSDFLSNPLPKFVHIHLLLVPVHSKKALADEFDQRLKRCQGIQ
jgi:hypothetical protein